MNKIICFYVLSRLVLICSLKGFRVIETSAADRQDSVDRLTLLIIKVHIINFILSIYGIYERTSFKFFTFMNIFNDTRYTRNTSVAALVFLKILKILDPSFPQTLVPILSLLYLIFSPSSTDFFWHIADPCTMPCSLLEGGELNNVKLLNIEASSVNLFGIKIIFPL